MPQVQSGGKEVQMQVLSLSVSAPGLKRSHRVDLLLEALEEFLKRALEEPESNVAPSSSPIVLNVSLSLKAQYQVDRSDAVSLSFEGNWTRSVPTQQS